MPITAAQGIVLRYADYREHDRMLTLLSPDEGVIEVISRGCRRPKSALMPCSEMFVCGQYELVFQNGRRSAAGCVLQDTFYPLRLDPYRLTCASYLAGLCEHFARPGQPAADLYALLLKGLYYLSYDTECDPLATTAAFQTTLIDLCGYRPRLKYCISCGEEISFEGPVLLDLEGGGLKCSHCPPQGPTASLRREDVVWLCDVLRNGFSARKETDLRGIFIALRKYLELRMDTVVKAGRMLP